MSQYYYEVSGLPDIAPDDTKLSLKYENYLQELMDALSVRDGRLLAYFRMKYENANLLAWLRDKEASFHPLGRLSAETFAEQLQMAGYDDVAPLEGVPPYMLQFLREREDGLITPDEEEKRLTALFYEYAVACKNRFVSGWFAFEQNLTNVQTALSCRRYGIDIESQVIGDNEVCRLLCTSTARDFNLSELFPQTETLLRLYEETDLLAREKKVDALKWQYLEELCVGHEFSVEVLLSYLIRLQGLERWIHLSPKEGEERFRTLIAALKENVQLPA